jgi:hypothetical protein
VEYSRALGGRFVLEDARFGAGEADYVDGRVGEAETSKDCVLGTC